MVILTKIWHKNKLIAIGDIEYTILETLTQKGKMEKKEIMKKLSSYTAKLLLKKMEKKGLITTDGNTATITEDGIEVYKKAKKIVEARMKAKRMLKDLYEQLETLELKLALGERT